MAKYSGRKGAVYLSTSGSGTATAVIGLTNWSLDRGTDRQESTSFGDVNKTYLQGLPDISGTFEGFWDDTEAKIFGAADSADGSKLYLYPSLDAPSKYWYGPAWIDASMETDVNDIVKISGSFSANGPWGNRF